jgi:ribulose kinase
MLDHYRDAAVSRMSSKMIEEMREEQNNQIMLEQQEFDILEQMTDSLPKIDILKLEIDQLKKTIKRINFDATKALEIN